MTNNNKKITLRLHRYIHCIMNSHNVFYLRMMAWNHQYVSYVVVKMSSRDLTKRFYLNRC